MAFNEHVATTLQLFSKRERFISIGVALAGLIWIGLLSQPTEWKVAGVAIWLLLITTAAVDWKTHLVHDIVPLSVLGFGAGYCVLTGQSPLYWGLGIGLNGLVMALLYLLSRKAIGLGDVKLMVALGLFLGPLKSFYLLFHASWMGAAVALAGLLMKRLDKNQELPFVPFLAFGFLLTLAAG